MKTEIETPAAPAAMVGAYIECALWSSTYSTEDSEDNNMDDGEHDLAPETRAAMEADCTAFLAYCAATGVTRDDWEDSQLGHDFWLTRNGHGTGFWDRGLPEGKALSDASKTFGSADLYIGDDGLIYQA